MSCKVDFCLLFDWGVQISPHFGAGISSNFGFFEGPPATYFINVNRFGLIRLNIVRISSCHQLSGYIVMLNIHKDYYYLFCVKPPKKSPKEFANYGVLREFHILIKLKARTDVAHLLEHNTKYLI